MPHIFAAYICRIVVYLTDIRSREAVSREKVADVTTHPAFKPIVDARARSYDMAHEDATRKVMTYADSESREPCCIANRLPRNIEDWRAIQ